MHVSWVKPIFPLNFSLEQDVSVEFVIVVPGSMIVQNCPSLCLVMVQFDSFQKHKSSYVNIKICRCLLITCFFFNKWCFYLFDWSKGAQHGVCITWCVLQVLLRYKPFLPTSEHPFNFRKTCPKQWIVLIWNWL